MPAPRPHPPRGLIFLASAWLVVAWVLSIGWRPPVQAHAASYMPGVRLLLLAVVSGICVAWPLVRLSGPPRAWPIRQALLDLAVLLCLAQVVVWPLRLVTTWTSERSALIDTCLGGWAVATTALVALGTTSLSRFQGTLRVLCMSAAVAMVAAAPSLALGRGRSLPVRIGSTADFDPSWWWTVAGSPLTAIHALTAGGADAPSSLEWAVARVGWWVALGAWAAVALTRIAPLAMGPTRRTVEDPAESAGVADRRSGAGDAASPPIDS